MKYTKCYCMLALAVMLAASVATHAQDGSDGKKKTGLFGRKKKKEQGTDGGVNEVSTGKSQSMTINIGGKKKDYILIDWSNAAGENIPLKDGQLEVQAKIFSTTALKPGNVVLYHNRQRSGARMDVSGLYGQQQEFNYTNRVALNEGANEIVLEVTTEKQSKKSEPLVVFRKGRTITIQSLGATRDTPRGVASVYWWTAYDPVLLNGQPYTTKEKALPLKFRILTPNNISLGQVRVVHNGKALPAGSESRLEKDSQGNFIFTGQVELAEQAGTNEVYLEVETNPVARSERLQVAYSPFRPNLHILCVGTETNLAYTRKDARDFAGVFKNQGAPGGNRLFSKILVDTLVGDHASAQEIRGTLEEFKVRYYTGSIGPDDIILAFISSHGFILDGDFRIQGDDYAPTRQRSTSVSFRQEIVGILEEVPCKKIIFVDACHSGGARANPADINFEISKLNAAKKGLTVFASSRGEEQSYEDPQWKNGAFTRAIIQGLTLGRADADKNHIVTLHELHTFVSKEVATVVRKVKNRAQNPVLVKDDLGDVALYVTD
ncbi:caspase family protein [Dawidia soli]|uniref:Caspase family protein n=1 Tax=Dawidia soli TaxID=2782352 RepID=A0AAP2DBI0_9BACT|nr:caspase family protein [Dawidia soli]MBT1687585.1 caspase family protein [Dawidia soli]